MNVTEIDNSSSVFGESPGFNSRRLPNDTNELAVVVTVTANCAGRVTALNEGAQTLCGGAPPQASATEPVYPFGEKITREYVAVCPAFTVAYCGDVP